MAEARGSPRRGGREKECMARPYDFETCSARGQAHGLNWLLRPAPP